MSDLALGMLIGVAVVFAGLAWLIWLDWWKWK